MEKIIILWCKGIRFLVIEQGLLGSIFILKPVAFRYQFLYVHFFHLLFSIG